MQEIVNGWRGNQVLRANMGSLAPALVVVGLRIFTRVHILQALRIDDWVLLGAVLCSICDGIAMSFEIRGGLGRPIATLSEDDLILFAKSLWISIIFYNISLALTKLSILLGYLHVFPNARVRLTTKISMGFMALCLTYWLVSTCLLCMPTARFWDKRIPGTCTSPKPFWLSHAALNIVTDLIIIIIPIPVLKSLNLPSKAKFWLIGVFCLGFVVTAVSIVRIPNLIGMFKSTDVTFDGTGAASLSAIESNVAIFCAALPPLRSFVKRYMPSLIDTLSTQSDKLSARSSRRGSIFPGGLQKIVTGPGCEVSEKEMV